MKDHQIKRAIIIAAGIGKRMRPLTLKTPKPLIEVNGVRMIDTVIDALLANGIDDINIVTGYMADSFEVLRQKYQMIRFINNPDFDKCNNISSLYYARELLDTDVLIADADLIINNPKILSPYFEQSGYNVIYVNSYTREWVMTVKNGIVTSCSRNGGNEGWQLYSISRWTREDAEKLKNYTVFEFIDNKRHDIYWDDIPVFLHHDDFQLGINVMQDSDLIEIDTLEELIKTDSKYMND